MFLMSVQNILAYNHVTFPFDVCTYDACQIFALMVVIKSGIKSGWLFLSWYIQRNLYLRDLPTHVL